MDYLFSHVDLTIVHKYSVRMRGAYPKIYGLEKQRKIWDPCGQAHSQEKEEERD